MIAVVAAAVVVLDGRHGGGSSCSLIILVHLLKGSLQKNTPFRECAKRLREHKASTRGRPSSCSGISSSGRSDKGGRPNGELRGEMRGKKKTHEKMSKMSIEFPCTLNIIELSI